MDKIFSQWIDQLNCEFKSPHTIRNYQTDVKQFLQFAADKGIDPLQLDRAKARLYFGFLTGKYSNHATIMRKRDAVKQFYRFLVSENHVSRNEFDFFDRMKVEQNAPAFLSQTEVATLLDSIAPNPALTKPTFKFYGWTFTRADEADFLACRDKAILETIYGCGTRAQETVNLNWRDIDFRAAFIRVNQGKGRKDRIIPITEAAIESLWKYGIEYRKRFKLEPAGLNPVFQSRERMRITTRSLQRIVKMRLALAGIDKNMSTHGLRHTFATHLMQRGADIAAIAECLGHASFSTTQRYTHVTLADVVNNYDMAHPRA